MMVKKILKTIGSTIGNFFHQFTILSGPGELQFFFLLMLSKQSFSETSMRLGTIFSNISPNLINHSASGFPLSSASQPLQNDSTSFAFLKYLSSPSF